MHTTVRSILCRATLPAVLVVAVAVSVPTGVGAQGATSPHTQPHATSAIVSASTSCPAPLKGVQSLAPGVHGATKTIALTFDDGPGRSTAAILQILLHFHVRATFFNIGDQEWRYPQDIREEGQDGFLVGDHSWSHPDLELLSPAAQRKELSWVGSEQHSLVGSRPCVFRPPYGDFDSTTLSIASSLNLTTWQWSASGGDWEADGSGSTYWIHRIIAASESTGDQPHPVLLLHNQAISMPATVAALPKIIEYFQNRGYTFVDLLGRSGPVDSCGVPVTAAVAPSTVLASGATIASGSSLSSPSGQFSLVMAANGQLSVETARGRVLWSTPTSGHPGATAVMQTDGHLAVVSASSQTLWSSPSSTAGATAALRDDGNLVVENGATVLWQSGSLQRSVAPGEHLRAGWYLESPNRQCRLGPNASGTLRLKGTTETLWSSNTLGPSKTKLTQQSDGNLELGFPGHAPLWVAGSSKYPGATLQVTNSGEAAVVSTKGQWLWSSG